MVDFPVCLAPKRKMLLSISFLISKNLCNILLCIYLSNIFLENLGCYPIFSIKIECKYMYFLQIGNVIVQKSFTKSPHLKYFD